jgi:hypothetical protein
MNTKSLSRLCGILFLLTIAVFLVGNMNLKEPLQDTENYSNTFQLVKDNASQYRLGNFLAFLGVVAQFALAITLFQILKPVNPFFALLALGWRIGEQVLLTVGIIAGFLILGLSQTVPLPPGNGIAELDYLGQILVSAPVHGEAIAYVFLGMGSVFNNMLFYKSKAIPSSLAIFGVIGAVLYVLFPALSMILDLPAAFEILLGLPLIIFELILGVYLIFRGLKKEIA